MAGACAVKLLDVEQRMVAERFAQTSEQQRAEIKLLQLGIVVGGMLGHVVGDGGSRGLQRDHEFFGQRGVRFIVHVLLFFELVPQLVHAVERLFQFGRRGLAQQAQAGVFEFGRIHLARARHHVVRLVHQHADLPVVQYRQAVQHGAQVEIIVIVADDHVAPARQFGAQVVRAHVVGQGHRAQGFAVER